MKWPFNPLAEEMYALYLTGASLAAVGRQYNRSREAVYRLFQYRGWKIRPLPAHLPHLDFNGSKYSMRNTGYYGKTTGLRTLMHRDVWEFYNGAIQRGWDVHHKDEDKTNNSIENLECLPKAEHTRLYSPHNNQYTKGRKREKCGA